MQAKDSFRQEGRRDYFRVEPAKVVVISTISAENLVLSRNSSVDVTKSGKK